MKRLGLLLILGLFLVNVSEVKANLHRIEASFIVNFFRYMQWGSIEGGQDFIVYVYGSGHAITKELSAKIAGQKYRTSDVKVVETKDMSLLGKGSILFIPKGKAYVLKKAKEYIDGKSILIITEEEMYVPKQTVVNFKVENSKLTFSINEDNAKARQIQISSKLISMAK